MMKNVQDFVAGLLFTAFGAAALWYGQGYNFGTATRMGPGYLPNVLGWSLVGIGVFITLRAFVISGVPIPRIYLRPQIMAGVPNSVREHVHFLGHVPSADLPRWYATGDIFCSPATGNESFGIVLIEAMAAGRAVVCSDIPGYRTVVTPGKDASVFPPGDVPSLARALSQLVEDPARRGRLAEEGRRRALEFSWPSVVDRIEVVYREAAGRRASALSGTTAA